MRALTSHFERLVIVEQPNSQASEALPGNVKLVDLYGRHDYTHDIPPFTSDFCADSVRCYCAYRLFC